MYRSVYAQRQTHCEKRLRERTDDRERLCVSKNDLIFYDDGIPNDGFQLCKRK